MTINDIFATIRDWAVGKFQPKGDYITEDMLGTTSLAGIGDGTVTGAISALNTGLNNKEWAYLGEASEPNVPIYTRSQVSGIKNIKIIVHPNQNKNWTFEFDKMQSELSDNAYNIFESKYVINNDQWQLIRLTLKVNKDGVTLKHCDIDGFDLTSNTHVIVYYSC